MKLIRIVLGLSLLHSAAVQAADWLPPLRLQYALVGSFASIALRGSGSLVWWQQAGHYQVELAGSSLVDASYRSRGRVSGDWLQPDRYDQQLFWRRQSVTFNRSSGQLQFSEAGGTEAIATDMQDSASVFAQLTHLFGLRRDWAAGQQLVFTLARPRGSARWVFRITDQPWLETAMGRLRCWHLQVLTPRGEPGDEVWLAPSLSNLPVQIRLQQGQDFLLFTALAPPTALEVPPPAPSSSP